MWLFCIEYGRTLKKLTLLSIIGPFGSYFLQIVDLIVFLKPWCVMIVGDGYYWSASDGREVAWCSRPSHYLEWLWNCYTLRNHHAQECLFVSTVPFCLWSWLKSSSEINKHFMSSLTLCRRSTYHTCPCSSTWVIWFLQNILRHALIVVQYSSYYWKSFLPVYPGYRYTTSPHLFSGDSEDAFVRIRNKVRTLSSAQWFLIFIFSLPPVRDFSFSAFYIEG